MVSGLIYTDPRPVITRRLSAVYQIAFRWTGSTPDAEQVVLEAFAAAFQDTSWPAPVRALDARLENAAFYALDGHWFDRHRVGATRHDIEECERLASGVPPRLESLFEDLTARKRLMLLLRFVRRRPLAAIAAQLGETRDDAATGLVEALAQVSRRLPLDTGARPAAAERVMTFVDAIVRGRRPPPASVDRGDWPLLAAAAHVQAGIAGKNLMRPALIEEVDERWMLLGDEAVTGRRTCSVRCPRPR